MKRTNYEDKKRVKRFLEIAQCCQDKEIKERRKAQERIEKYNSVEFKTSFEQRKCTQALYPLEKELNKAQKSGDEEKIKQAKENLLKAIDKSSADSVGAIMAQIKQNYLVSNGQKLKDIIIVNLSVDDFYNNFESVCANAFNGCSIDKNDLRTILKPFTDVNFPRIKSLGETLNYNKPIEQLNKNVDIIEQTVVKEQELSL